MINKLIGIFKELSSLLVVYNSFGESVFIGKNMRIMLPHSHPLHFTDNNSTSKINVELPGICTALE